MGIGFRRSSADRRLPWTSNREEIAETGLDSTSLAV
jgi:hypothetical protein